MMKILYKYEIVYLRIFSSDVTFVFANIVQWATIKGFKTHSHLGKTVPLVRGHILSFIASSYFVCKVLSWGKTIEEYLLGDQLFVSLICLFILLFNLSWNYIFIIQVLHPYICLYLGVNFFNWYINKSFNAVSLTNNLLLF